MRTSYLRFGSMILTSTVLMYAFMYLHTYEWAHVRWSTTRLYMSLLMAATMVWVMLSFMLSMYKNKTLNLFIYVFAAVVFAAALYFVRAQTFIGETAWMKAMIPHHSIAILTSERASLNDARVKMLSRKIIEAQRKEIKEMEWLIEDISKNGIARDEAEATARPVPSF